MVKFSSFENYQLGGIPVGWFVNSRIEASEDFYTQKGICEARKVLNSRGLMVACGHRNYWDMVAQGIGCLQEFPSANLILPISAHYYTKKRLYRFFFEPICRVVPNVQILPVMRKEESGMSDRQLGVEEKLLPSNPNGKYLRAVLRAVKTPNFLVVLSPFGTREKHQNGIRSGVRLLLKKKKMPAICADVAWNRRRRQMVVGFSDKIFEFDEEHNSDEMNKLFLEQFREIRDRLVSHVVKGN